MTRRIDLLAGTRNTPTAIDGLHSAHDSSEIFADRQIAACQFLQRADSCSAVIDRAELVHVQPVGQLACIDLVILVPLPGVLPRIAHHEFRYVRLQQVIQPGGPGSFFKSDLQLSPQPVDKVQNAVRFGLDHAFHHDLPGIIPDRNRNTFLVHIHADIFSASHIRVFLSGGVRAEHSKPYSKRGALLYCVVGAKTPTGGSNPPLSVRFPLTASSVETCSKRASIISNSFPWYSR